MATDIDNLLLEYLRAIRGDVGDLCEDVRELRYRVSSIDSALGSVRRELSETHADVLITHGRIESRLDLSQ